MMFFTRNQLNSVITFGLLFLLGTVLSAQNGRFDVRFALKNLDCANKKVSMQVQIKARDLSHTFRLGDANLYFDYNPEVIRNPQLESQENFSNQLPANDINYNAQTLSSTPVTANISSLLLSTIYGGGGFGAKLVGTEWLTIASVRFDIQDATQCITLIWHDLSRLPISTIAEIELTDPTPDGNYNQYILTEGTNEDFSQCIPPICSNVIAVDDNNATKINTLVTGSAATNDVSNGGAMTFAAIGVGTNGTWVLEPNGNYTYTPTTEFLGTASQVYQVCNTAGLCDTATIYVEVFPSPNKPPVISETPKTVAEDVQTTVCVPFSDPNSGDSHTAILCGTKGGTAVSPTIENNQVCFNYTSAHDFNGRDTVCLIVCDQEGLCDTAQIPIAVTPMPDAPTLVDVLPTTVAEDSTITVCGTIMDVDTPNGPFTFSTCSTLWGGVVTPSVNGNELCINYLPTANYNGLDTICLVVCDQSGLCFTLQKVITVTSRPDAPMVTKDPKTTSEDTQLAICQTITDSDVGDIFSVTLYQQPTHGFVSTPSVNGHQACLNYMPSVNYSGLDTVCFVVCDQTGLCDTAKIVVTVAPVNDKPTIHFLPASGVEDSLITVCVTVSDPDLVSIFTASLCQQPNHGFVNDPSVSDNQICVSYMPSVNYNGLDTFCLIVCDQGGLCDTAKIPLTITPKNDAPTVTENPKTTTEGTPVQICQTVSDPDFGDTFTAYIGQNATHGTTMPPSVNGNQICLMYSPTANYNGLDTVHLIVCDNSGLCDTANIPVVITLVNTKPIISFVPQTVVEDSTISICASFSDVDGGRLFVANLCQQPSHGVASEDISVIGNQICTTYTPSANYDGKDTLCLILCDETNLCDTAKIPITVMPRPDAPDFVGTPIATVEDSTVQVCYAITDPDLGSVFTASLCNEPVNGTVSTPVIKDNKFCFDYAPNINFNGQDTVCITVCDQTGLCKTVKIPVTVTPVADPPRIVNRLPSMIQEDSSFSICSTIVDPDTPDGPFVFQVCKPSIGEWTASILTGGQNGNQLCINYKSKPNYFGQDTICLSVCDATGLCDVLNRIITINPANDSPIVRDSLASTTPGQLVATCLPISDADIADTHLVFTCENAQHGIINAQIDNRNLCINYTASPEYVGKDSVCFIVCDNGAPFACDTVKMFYEIKTTNSPPVATDDFNTVLSGKTTSGNVLTNDADANSGQILTPSVIISPKHAATFGLNPDGDYSFKPTDGFLGIDTITYKICDNGVPSMCDTAILTIKIRPVAPFGNQYPEANDDITSTPSGQPITINVKSNDIDPNPTDTLSPPVLLAQPACGTAVVNTNGRVTYTPSPNFVGVCTVQYSICDNGSPSLCDTATLYVTVYPNPFINNQAPFAADDAATTTLNRAVTGNVATNDTDLDVSQILSFSSISTPRHGSVVLQTNGVYTYTPAVNFIGRDSFLYKVCDNGAPSLCDTAWVFVAISNPIVVNNVSPVANPDNSTTTAGIPITIFVKANDYDPNGDPLSMPMILGQPNGGTATVNANGTISFVPNTGFSGISTFIYQVCDEIENLRARLCDTALVTVVVKPIPAPANRAPVAINDAFIASANQPLSNISIAANDSDPDVGQTLTFAQLSAATHGLLAFNATAGTFSYFPQSNFVGVDSFRYKVCDNGAPSLCDTAWAYVTYINPPVGNQAPIAMDDATETLVNTTIRIPVLSNDKDPNKDPLSNPTILNTPTCGTATVNTNGTIDFAPAPNFVGTCGFAYKVCDNSLCDTAIVIIKVNPLPSAENQSPIAINDATTTSVNTSVNESVATNDSDPDVVQTLTFTPLINSFKGTVVLQNNGSYIYTPNTGFVGRDSFVYKVCDNGIPSLCTTALVQIDVTELGVNVNIAPTANDDKAVATTNALTTISVLANDYDVNTNQTLGTPTILTPMTCGLAFVQSGGSIAFKSAPNFTGVCSLSYRVCDNGSPTLCDTATLEITVKPVPTLNIVNIAPTAVDDANANYKNVVQRGHIEENDNDANLGQTLTFKLIEQATSGFVLLSSGGSYMYRPDSNFVGTDHFTYQICDNGAPNLCDTATVYLTIFDKPCINLNLKVWLEGAYSTTTNKMRTTLNQRGLLPGQTPVGEYAVKTKVGQPYNTAPWNYAGTEGDTMTTYPATTVDWVLVSLRTSLNSIMPVWRSAGLLHENGSISFVNDCIDVPIGSYYIVIEHRNHLGVMSPIAVSTVTGTMNFDFTLSDSYIIADPPSFGSKVVSNGQWVMYSGDGMKTTQSNNFDINALDAQLWNGQSGLFDRYLRGDYNLDADINSKDQILWKNNSGRYSGIPH